MIEVARDLEALDLRATVCGGAGPYILPTAHEPPLVLDELHSNTTNMSTDDCVGRAIQRLRRIAPLEPDCVSILTGPQGHFESGEAWELVVEGLSQINEEAVSLGIRLALEPVHPRFAKDFSIVSTLHDARELLDDVGSDNIGILVDTFHVAGLENAFDQIRNVRGRIAAVHLSDSMESPQSAGDRVMPGDGVVKLAEMIVAIEQTGYTGWYDCEVPPGSERCMGGHSLSLAARRCVDGFLSLI